MSVLREHCLPLQHFSYECRYKRNAGGDVYGASLPVYLDFTVRVASPESIKDFFREIVDNDRPAFSVLFNATFGPTARLADYEDGMIVRGYVVDIEEEYESAPGADNISEQMLAHIKLLVTSITFLGASEENNYTMTIIQ